MNEHGTKREYKPLGLSLRDLSLQAKLKDFWESSYNSAIINKKIAINQTNCNYNYSYFDSLHSWIWNKFTIYDINGGKVRYVRHLYSSLVSLLILDLSVLTVLLARSVLTSRSPSKSWWVYQCSTENILAQG